MIPTFPVYLFDIDGTLLDSATDICGAVQDVLSQTPAPPVSFAFLKKYVGFHLAKLFEELLPGYSSEQVWALVQEYRRIYPARGHRETRVYSGVEDTLKRLPGKKATATTKMTHVACDVLTQFGLAQYFDHIQGTDGFPSKPAPDVLFAALKGLAARPEDCLLVGDSSADMEAGRRAGIKTCAVRYGYGEPHELARWEPDYWVSDLSELLG